MENWVSQLLVRLGVLRVDGDSVPAYLEVTVTNKIKLEQITFFKETHS